MVEDKDVIVASDGLGGEPTGEIRVTDFFWVERHHGGKVLVVGRDFGEGKVIIGDLGERYHLGGLYVLPFLVHMAFGGCKGVWKMFGNVGRCKTGPGSEVAFFDGLFDGVMYRTEASLM